MKELIKKALPNSYSYREYTDFVNKLVLENKTTGPNQSESLVGYTKLNAARMKRLEKKYKPSEDIKRVALKLNREETWLVITEAWCGDAAQNIPIIAKIAGLNANISLRFVMRDDNLALMDLFLTNGARGIPKLIQLDQSLNVLNTWGPRPKTLQEMALAYKNEPNMPYADFSKQVQHWYNQDLARELESEMIAMISSPEVIMA